MNDLSGSEVVFEGDKSVLELGIGDGCTLYDKCPWVIYFNIVNLNLYEFSLNSEKIQEIPQQPSGEDCTFIVEGPGLIPDWGTKIPQAAQCGQNK